MEIFTTKGYVPAETVKLVESITRDDEDFKIVRTDKYIGEEWVGNDLNIIVKRTQVNIGAETAQLGG